MPDRSLDKLLLRNAAGAEATTRLFERELAKRYREAYAEIEAQIGALWAKMGEPPSLVEARKYGRLQAVQDAIAAEYRALTRRAIAGTRDNSAEVFSRAAYGTQWAYDQAIGVEVKWPLIPVEAIRASVWSADTGENYAQRYKNWEARYVTQIQRRVTSGIALGQGYAKTARTLIGQNWFQKTVADIRGDINKAYEHAVMIVRTESTRNYTSGHLEVYDNLEKVGISARKQWVATLDTRTRDTHGELDGTLADEDGLFHLHGLTAEGPGHFNDPAEDINCRCRIVDVIEGTAPEYRRIRGEGIVPYQSYAQWAGARGWTAGRGWPIEAKAKVAAEQAVKY